MHGLTAKYLNKNMVKCYHWEPFFFLRHIELQAWFITVLSVMILLMQKEKKISKQCLIFYYFHLILTYQIFILNYLTYKNVLQTYIKDWLNIHNGFQNEDHIYNMQANNHFNLPWSTWRVPLMELEMSWATWWVSLME